MAPEQHRGHSRDYTGPVIVHARKDVNAVALCGAKPGSPWTRKRSEVTCVRCLVEVERRLRHQRRR
jgi:hypothetical protein